MPEAIQQNQDENADQNLVQDQSQQTPLPP